MGGLLGEGAVAEPVAAKGDLSGDLVAVAERVGVLGHPLVVDALVGVEGALAFVEAFEAAAVVTSPGGERPEPRRVLGGTGALCGEAVQLDGAVGGRGGDHRFDVGEAGGGDGPR